MSGDGSDVAKGVGELEQKIRAWPPSWFGFDYASKKSKKDELHDILYCQITKRICKTQENRPKEIGGSKKSERIVIK